MAKQLIKFFVLIFVMISILMSISSASSTNPDKGEVSNNDVRATDNFVEIETNQPLSKEERESIDKRFLSFLNAEGAFSDKAIKKNAANYIDTRINDLGRCIVGVFSSGFQVQGILLGCFKFTSNNYVAIGVKNKDGNREIVLAQWLINEMIDVYSSAITISFYVTKNSRHYRNVGFTSESELLTFINRTFLNQVVIFNFYRINSEQVKDNYENIKHAPFLRDYVVPKYETNVKFASNLMFASAKKGSTPPPTTINSDAGIRNFADVIYRVNNYQNDIPLLNVIMYRKLDASKINLNYSGNGETSKTAPVIDLAASSTTIQLTANVLPSVANQNVVWKSSNPKVASVNETGLVIGRKKGSVTITATAEDSGKVKTSLKVNVTWLAKGITISGSNTLQAGKKTNLKATVLPEETVNKKVTWSSSDTAVATVSASGVVTAKKVTELKTVTITATSKDGNGVLAEFVMTIMP